VSRGAEMWFPDPEGSISQILNAKAPNVCMYMRYYSEHVAHYNSDSYPGLLVLLGCHNLRMILSCT
jgi:hypothetical protein